MSRTGMLQRCWEHDYCAPCFYLITIVTEPRRNCLGVLRTGGAGTVGVELSPLGEVVEEVWRRTSFVYPNVEACECVVMPDHFHGILRVKERLARPLGHIVKAFKLVSERESCGRGLGQKGGRKQGAASGTEPGFGAGGSPLPPGIWQAGFQDSILLRRGHLQAMANYIADNPRRLAAKRANPALFTVAANHEIIPGKTCAVIGNRFLLQHPLKRQVQVSRRITEPELAARQEELLYAAAHGTVLVSPCISPGEKAVARAALAAGHPLIVLLANGFAPLYKPPGRYFDACASGRLLMLAPFPYQRQRQAITREQCLELNGWAREIVAMHAPLLG